jgi:hypothetical protein
VKTIAAIVMQDIRADLARQFMSFPQHFFQLIGQYLTAISAQDLQGAAKPPSAEQQFADEHDNLA